MASAQVLPNLATSSRKKDHLQAGKKRLEEFRKKKAAEQAKKAASNSQLHVAGAGVVEKQSSPSDDFRLTESAGASTSDESSSVVMNNGLKASEFVHRMDIDSSSDINAYPSFTVNNHNIYSADPVQFQANNEDIRDVSTGPFEVDGSENGTSNDFGHAGTSGRFADGIDREQITSFYSPSVQGSDSSSSKYSYIGMGSALANNSDSKNLANPGTSDAAVTNVTPETHGNMLLQKTPGFSDLQANGLIPSLYGGYVHLPPDVTETYSEDGKNIDRVLVNKNHFVPDMGERKLSSSVGHINSATSPSIFSTESRSTGFSFDTRSSTNHLPLSTDVGTNIRKSRPSFLDSITTSKASSTIPKLSEPQKDDSFSLKFNPMNVPTSSAFQDSMISFASGNGSDLLRHNNNEHIVERKHDLYSTKQNEDFDALEQHIEDLTQEKFSLQRALEASRALAESLASENSALTDSYNQQGSVVHQLKSDMEKLQEEIQAHLVELESFKTEYTNAQLECNAADERAKLLASEVIGLEEKALRLRSSELKLERQLENSQAEISSFRKKITSIEKDRQDLKLTIEALQEEKKLLESKLRKASTNGKFVDVPNLNKKNVSTSTDDLDSDSDNGDTSNLEMHSNAQKSDAPSQPENGRYTLEGLFLGLPPDQMRMIQNINTIMSELALEKQELVQALSAESSQCSKLKDLNLELSRKLEIQTQRLELLTSQSMANGKFPARQQESLMIPDNIPYADEGDEVVERVLGWIMKLFPGGPSKRRTRKLI